VKLNDEEVNALLRIPKRVPLHDALKSLGINAVRARYKNEDTTVPIYDTRMCHVEEY